VRVPVIAFVNVELHERDVRIVEALGKPRALQRRIELFEPGAILDDGMLDVVVIKPMSRGGLVRTYPKLFKGTHVTHPQYEHHRVRSVTVAAPGIVAYADGERFGALPVTVECVPGALNVLS